MNNRLEQFLYLLSILIASLVLFSCGRHQPAESSKTPPIAVTTSLPLTVNDRQFSISGKVESIQKAEISTRIMGYINRVNAKVGDRVNQGQLLAVIESSDIQARQSQAEAMLSQAEAALINAQKDYERFKQLHQQKSASDKELENVQLQYQSATAQAEVARQMRNEALAMKTYTNITAPFDGTITQKLADAGAIANPGMPLFSLEGNRGFHITTLVPESEILTVTKDQPVQVTIPSSATTFNATISEISHSSLLSGGQYMVRVNVPDSIRQGIYSGQYATLILTVSNHLNKPNNLSIRVPMSSIVTNNQLTGLFTISTSNTALLRWVRLGKQFGNDVEVIAGLSANEPFILSAGGKLWNGAPVVVHAN